MVIISKNNYISIYEKNINTKLAKPLTIHECTNTEEYIEKIKNIVTERKIKTNILKKIDLWESSSGMMLYNNGEKPEYHVVLNKSKAWGTYDYKKKVFHELGHVDTIRLFKDIDLKLKKYRDYRVVNGRNLLSEIYACYYSHLCLSQLYELNKEDTIEEMIDIYNSYISSRIPIYMNTPDSFITDTEFGELIAKSIVYYSPIINTIGDQDAIFSKFNNPSLAKKLYNLTEFFASIIKRDIISKELCIQAENTLFDFLDNFVQ